MIGRWCVRVNSLDLKNFLLVGSRPHILASLHAPPQNPPWPCLLQEVFACPLHQKLLLSDADPPLLQQAPFRWSTQSRGCKNMYAILAGRRSQKPHLHLQRTFLFSLVQTSRNLYRLQTAFSCTLPTDSYAEQRKITPSAHLRSRTCTQRASGPHIRWSLRWPDFP
jgi:hypothetical protein